MRLVFFGTPAFAVPTLDALGRAHDVAFVVAQPDKPAGRGMKMQAPAVVARARELGLRVAQPAKVREIVDDVRAVQPDAGIVVAYGRILPASLLEIPRYGFLNIHGSILPKYRGAAPIQRAIERGETETGVTIMRVDEQLDHGPILSILRTPIGPDEHTPSLAARLSSLGADALLDVLARIGSIDETPQDHDRATYAAKIEKSEGEVQWTQPAKTIYDKFRAFDPWPGVFTPAMKLVDILPASGSGEPGRVIRVDAGVVVACGEGALELRRVQRPGKATVDAKALQWRVGDHV